MCPYFKMPLYLVKSVCFLQNRSHPRLSLVSPPLPPDNHPHSAESLLQYNCFFLDFCAKGYYNSYAISNKGEADASRKHSRIEK